ncbi:hypothetical protein [Leifsonia sp. Leaf264]|uniref:hypothetical protein n=1 Tax=Leifsonia sp. Leaf264 TaxID=1736314 RepID=UPI0012FB299B|nr:hypothetical protein [Leifsonia sp. Leaf264]
MATVRRTRAAIDLASIMVGVLVIAIVAGALSVTTFGVIPWAQNEAAKAYLTEVSDAESAAKLPNPTIQQSGRYLPNDLLATAGFLDERAGATVATDLGGTCFAAVAKSDSGPVYWVSDRSPKPLLYLGDHDPCTDLSAMVAAVGGAQGLTSVTNLLTNPSWEAVTPGTALLRSNLTQSPAVQSVAGWSVSAAGGAAQGSAGGKIGPAGASYKGTVAATSGSASIAIAATAPGGFIPAASYTASIYGTVTWNAVTFASISWFDASGTLIGTTSGSASAQTAGAVARRSVAGVAPTNAATATVQFVTDSSAPPKVGDTASASAALFERTTSLRTYFDGSTVDTNGWAFAWDGPASVAMATPVESRRNLASYTNGLGFMPDVTGAGFRNSRAPANVTYSIVPTPTDAAALSARSYVRKTWKAVTTGAGNGFALTQADPDSASPGTDTGLPVDAGQTYTISSYVKASATGKAALVRVRFFTPGSGWVGAATSGASLSLSANAWARPRLTITAPTGATMAAIVVDTGAGTTNWKAGDTFDATQLLIEEGSALQSYFDGTTGSGGGASQEWVGEEGKSPSRAMSPLPAGAESSLSGNDRVATVGGTAWKTDGAQSIRISALGDGTATSVTVAGSGAGLSGHGVTLEPGKTYTMVGTAQLSVTQKGTLDSRARSIVFADSTTGDAGIRSDQLPNVVGAGDLRLTFTVSPSATWATIRLFNGASVGNGDVSWDHLALIEGEYTGPAFNGNTPRTDQVRYDWAGPGNASASTMHRYR